MEGTDSEKKGLYLMEESREKDARVKFGITAEHPLHYPLAATH